MAPKLVMLFHIYESACEHTAYPEWLRTPGHATALKANIVVSLHDRLLLEGSQRSSNFLIVKKIAERFLAA